jgi:hypothetical protein
MNVGGTLSLAGAFPIRLRYTGPKPASTNWTLYHSCAPREAS